MKIPGTLAQPESGAPRAAYSAYAIAGRVTAFVHVPAEAEGRYFHETLRTPHGMRLLFGEIDGDPKTAGESASLMLGAFRRSAPVADDLAEVANRSAAALLGGYRQGAYRHGANLARIFVVQHGDDATLSIINRGYPAPILVSGRQLRPLTPPLPMPPVGVLAPGSVHPPVLTAGAFPGDRILFHTGAAGTPTAPDEVLSDLRLRLPDLLQGEFAATTERLVAALAAADHARHIPATAVCLLDIGH
ncbi:SpoIIE family protein phosphatase [Yinghuangia seranimata]|uniref:SpoIIE family protein phosphatase n=1 Tax=Yinghuangia seranimata TaxID=408067 RepID=UPI00248CD649|nr:SpoIIE family protein phosphatase [Yinghuangia seranimata]MDI2129865.1 SpoIIE family protein phosphatase [Yinghuangia seranimata]